MDIFSPVVRYRPEYIFAAEGRGGGRAEALSSHLSMDIFLRNLSHRRKYIFTAEARGTTAAQAV